MNESARWAVIKNHRVIAQCAIPRRSADGIHARIATFSPNKIPSQRERLLFALMQQIHKFLAGDGFLLQQEMREPITRESIFCIDFTGFIQNNGYFILKWIGYFNIAADHCLQIFQLRANTDFFG